MTPPELQLPSDYSLHNTRGISLMMNYLMSNLWEFSEVKGADQNIVQGPLPVEKFWLLDEVVSKEGDDALIALKNLVHNRFIAQSLNSDSASLATYLIGLFYTLILSIWFFRPMLSSFTSEIRHNRACKFLILIIVFAMVPVENIVVNQPMVDYIERVFKELNEI